MAWRVPSWLPMPRSIERRLSTREMPQSHRAVQILLIHPAALQWARHQRNPLSSALQKNDFSTGPWSTAKRSSGVLGVCSKTRRAQLRTDGADIDSRGWRQVANRRHIRASYWTCVDPIFSRPCSKPRRANAALVSRPIASRPSSHLSGSTLAATKSANNITKVARAVEGELP